MGWHDLADIIIKRFEPLLIWSKSSGVWHAIGPNFQHFPGKQRWDWVEPQTLFGEQLVKEFTSQAKHANLEGGLTIPWGYQGDNMTQPDEGEDEETDLPVIELFGGGTCTESSGWGIE